MREKGREGKRERGREVRGEGREVRGKGWGGKEGRGSVVDNFI